MKILMRTSKNTPWALVESAAYGAEAELQKLLAETPSLISINEVREGTSPLYAAVREFPLPIGSVDLLAFNPEGEIVVIECKLATNQEIKRKVIGQVLEYGANLWEMSYSELDQTIKLRTGQNLAELMQGSFNSPEDEETFRLNVETHLKSGNFILMIVVDEINEELSRIVRYLNVSGKTAFSLAALEMRRFHSDQIEMLVPRVFGSAPPPPPPPEGGRKRWTEQLFFDDAASARRSGRISDHAGCI